MRKKLASPVNLSKGTYALLAQVNIALRIITPFFISWNPFIVALFLGILDSFDFVFIMNGGLLDKEGYQKLDKFLDWYYLVFFFFFAIIWGIPILVWLFVYRFIGFVLFLAFRERRIFVFFPNVFEVMFILFAFGVVYSPSFLELLNENLPMVLLITTFLKLLQEYYLHWHEGESLWYVFGVVKKSH